MFTIAKNEKWNSYELTFDGKPSEQVRDILKANGYRWNRARGLWYGYADIFDELNASTGETAANAETPTEAAEQPASKATPIKFYYNGIKLNGRSDLIKCGYYINDDCVNIYADGYGGQLPRDLFNVKNETDVYTDYFDNDSATVTPSHPLYKFVLYYAKKAEYMTHKRILKQQEKNKNLWSCLTVEERRAKVKEFEQLPGVGQPTNADLLKVDEMNERAEAERKAKAEEEERKAERNAAQKKAFGAWVIEEAQRVYPLPDGAKDYAEIGFSEHPAFYDLGVLKLSILAADYILRILDERQREDRSTQNGIGWYDKTDFTIYKDGEAVYSGRYDIGDGEGGLIAHIEQYAKWNATHNPFGKPKDEKTEEDAARLAFVEWLKGIAEQTGDDVESLDSESAEYQAYFN